MISQNNLTKLQCELEYNEALLILSDINRFYLTGFKSTAGFCIITRHELIFYTDFRYIEAALHGVKYFTVTEEKGNRTELIEFILTSNKINTLYLELNFISVAYFKTLKDKLDKVILSNDSKFDKMISGFRKIKTLDEIELIKTASAISDKSFTDILPLIKPNISEKDIAAELEYRLKKNGGDGLAFDTIAVAGKNSAKPHGVPSDYKIQNGDFISFDFGTCYKGYMSDMTRTVAVGNLTDEMRNVYATVLKAQLASLAEIKSGANCKDIDAVARKIISEAGYGNCFGHGLGHSLGIEIHEIPSLSPKCEERLFENNVITCEPGIYIESKFGVRIEDTVLVKKEGYEPLNKITKELIVL